MIAAVTLLSVPVKEFSVFGAPLPKIGDSDFTKPLWT